MTDDTQDRDKPTAFREWVCADCGHEVLAVDRPAPIKWTDGHRCEFIEAKGANHGVRD